MTKYIALIAVAAAALAVVGMISPAEAGWNFFCSWSWDGVCR